MIKELKDFCDALHSSFPTLVSGKPGLHIRKEVPTIAKSNNLQFICFDDNAPKELRGFYFLAVGDNKLPMDFSEELSTMFDVVAEPGIFIESKEVLGES